MHFLLRVDVFFLLWMIPTIIGVNLLYKWWFPAECCSWCVFTRWIHTMNPHDEFTRRIHTTNPHDESTRWIHTKNPHDEIIWWFFLPRKRFIIHCWARCGRWSVGMGFTDHYDPWSFLDDFEPNPPHHIMSKKIYFCAMRFWFEIRIAIGFYSVMIQFEIIWEIWEIWEIYSKEINFLLVSPKSPRTQPGFFPIVPYMTPKAVYVFSYFFPSLFLHNPLVPRGELGSARKNAALLKSRTKIYNAFGGGSKHSGPSNQKKRKEKKESRTRVYRLYAPPPPILLASSHTYLKFLPIYSMHAYVYDEHTIYTYMRGAHCFSNHPATCTLFPLTTFFPYISLPCITRVTLKLLTTLWRFGHWMK